MMEISDKKNAQFLVYYLKQVGIKDIIICPGSRNLPLILSFENDSFFEIHTVIDERSAGFIALGLSRASHNPVAILTTSGSATLNLAPSILEAYYEQIPLLAITADRPPEWIDKGENQTFRQQNIFQNYIQAAIQLDEKIDFESANDLFETIHPHLFYPPQRGPVHINIPFSEPLLNTKVIIGQYHYRLPKSIITYKNNYSSLRQYQGKSIMIYNSKEECSSDLLNILERGVANHGWLVINEFQTNIEVKGELSHFDTILSKYQNKVDILITIGNQILSKFAKNYFKSQKNLIHIDVSEYKRAWDNISHQYIFFQDDSTQFLTNLYHLKLANHPEYYTEWKSQEAMAIERYRDFQKEEKYQEFSIIHHIIQSFDSPVDIFWGNSSVVRYAHWSSKNNHITHHIVRGVSGIDGVLSTAMGYQLKAKKDDFYCILGDISILYETNALQSLFTIGNLKIIVLNNHGGKIFDNIHSLSSHHIVQTEHSYQFHAIAEMYHLQYFKSESLEDFQSQWTSFRQARNTRAIFEIILPPDSHTQWKEYWAR